MKSAIVLLPVLALACYAAPDVYVPWTYPVSGAATFQERNPYQSYMPVQEQGYPIADTSPAAIQTKTRHSVCVNSLESGAVEVVYKTPNKGRVSLFFRNSNGDILITIDARVDWYGWENILVLNSKPAHGSWMPEDHPTGFPFPCCGYVTTVTLRVELGDVAFIISANGNEISRYLYRPELRPPVTEIEYVFDDTGASEKAKLENLSIDY